MFTSRNFKALILLSASLLFFHPHARAQSGRKPWTPKPLTQPAPTPAGSAHYEEVRVVAALGREEFVKALNEQGRLGYRLEKTVGDGGADPRSYAAVLRLDPGHTYDYVSDPLSEDPRFGTPLNYYPERGYAFVHAYGAVQCRQVEVFDPNATPDYSNRQETREERSNVLLFMRRDGANAQTKEYRAFKGRFTLDGGQKKELQAALDAAPPGFRPVHVLFAGDGELIVNVTILAERDLNEAAPPKVEYEMVKEVFGFEDKINSLAAAGSRYVVGGRLGFVKIALLERQAGGATAYTFKDDRQHRKEFPKMLAAGNSYAGLLVGDPRCDSGDGVFLQKFVFARAAGGTSPGEYKILQIPDRGPDKKKLTGLLPDASVSELRRLLADGFRVRDLFYNLGLYAILERPAKAPDARETSER
ncbi:MAG: hypothetical protein ABW208_26380 [Pyrinomonadaceae bacterium]